LLKNEQDRVNLYAVILDSSAPYFMEKTGKYQCTMKLIDPSINSEKKGTPGFMSATIFAKTQDEIPKVSKVGSIIRFHRAQTKKYKDIIQINCDIIIKGAWVLFDPAEVATPIAESGKSSTFEPVDKTLLKDIRKFAKDFFAKQELPSMTLEEAAKKKPKDFDVIVLVVSVKKEKGGLDRVKLCDAGKVAKLTIPKGRGYTLTKGEVVRIRSANYKDKKETELELNEYSNVLRVPNEYKSAKKLLENVEGPKAHKDVKAKITLHTPHLNAPMAGSKITDTHKISKVSHLKDMFSGVGEKQKFFKVQVSVSEIGPKDPKEWICVVDKKTKKQYTLEEAFKGKKSGKLPAGMEYYYKMQLFVQDKSAKNDSSMYILFLCTHEGKCKEFIKMDLGRDYPSEKTVQELKRLYKTLTNPWVALDLMVEHVEVAKKQPVFFLVDTALTI